MNRRIQDLSDSKCYHNARFSKEQLELLLDLIFRRMLRGTHECKIKNSIMRIPSSSHFIINQPV